MKKFFVIFFILVINCLSFAVSVSIIYSNNFRINLEKVELYYYNKSVMDVDLKVFKYNRTTFASNASVSIKEDISRQTIVRVKTYEFMNNEYRPFAVNAQKKFCDFIKEEYTQYFYDDFNKEGSHIFPKKCPTPIGKYYLTNYIPDSKFYKVELPFQKLAIETKAYYKKKLVCHFKYFVQLDHDAVFRETFG